MDDLVRSVTCYNPRPILLHGYLAPFFVLQAVVYYYFSQGIQNQTNSSPHNDTLALDKSNLEAANNTETLNNDTASFDTERNSASVRHSYEIAVIAVTISVVAQVITYLFCHWSVDVKCWLSYSRCNDPHLAKYAKVTPNPNNGSAELVQLKRETIAKCHKLSFVFQKTKYVYDEKSAKFNPVDFQCDHRISYYKQWTGYEEQHDVDLIDRQYGHNELDMVIPEFKELFVERATAPFFVFQTFCVGLWCLDEFWYYALFTLLMLVTFEMMLVKHQLRNMQEIRNMGNKPFMIQVFRQRKWKSIRSDLLIPGDLVSIVRSDNNIPCDILLLKGSCIVDESTLTGESVPQMKEPLEDLDESSDRRFDINQDKLHILSGGTKILQHCPPPKEPGCLGYVLKTGFHTSQGKLLRTILFGVKRVTANNFETFCFIMFLLFFAVLSAYYVWTKGVEDPKRSRYRLFFECTVIVTSVVPPELPIELSLAVNSSLISLSQLYIYCTEPFRIPFAGKVEYCCFDKTGTLTSDDLIVEGVVGIPKQSDQQEKDEPVLEQKQTQSGVSSLKHQDSNSQSSKSSLKSTSLLSASSQKVLSVEHSPSYTQQVLASCHSLTYLDDKLVGDPLEKKVLEATHWNYSKAGIVTPKRGRSPPLKIHQRFYFNSTLKRMSVIASYKMDMSNENVYVVTAKGAPEFMRPLLKQVPDDYDKLYLEMSRLGARVLALGYRTLGSLSYKELSELKREDAESNLMFAGFVLISCPLKPDSKDISIELENSGHRLVMITGDGALTACHVAGVLNFVRKEVLILTKTCEPTANAGNDNWSWMSTDQKTCISFSDAFDDFIKFFDSYDLCVTGDALEFIVRDQKEKIAHEIIRRTKVFARVSPKQKELIITQLKSRGKVVLMCGDGTNDVGALKHADCGVALLSSVGSFVPRQHQLRNQKLATPINETPANRLNDKENKFISGGAKSGQTGAKSGPSSPANKRQGHSTLQTGTMAAARLGPMTAEERRREKQMEAQTKLKELLEEKDGPQFVKLGDASIAAPFTSRLSSIECISHIIKQGRCTLVTTLQMFKILALNALLSAYCHSVLYLDGIKFSDAQITVQGLLSTFCFLFITRSQPLKKLSSQRPLPNIFNLYSILTVTLQFAIHFSALVFLYARARLIQESLDKVDAPTNSTALNIEDGESSIDSVTTINSAVSSKTYSDNEDSISSLHTEFKKSLINSTVYVIWMSVQLATFVVNYKGHPFMQDLRSNKLLCYSFIGSTFVVFACVNNWSPGLTEQLSVVEFPIEFRSLVLGVIVADVVLAFVVDRVCEYFFGRLKLKTL